jgi:hypothetical protein
MAASTDLLTEAMAGRPVLLNGVRVQFEILRDGMDPCGKKWFKDQAEAEREMEHMHSIRGPEYELNAYYCYDCDGFHIGHTRIRKEGRR